MAEGRYSLDDLKVSPTASLFEGFRDENVDLSFFFTRTPPGAEVGLHVHPYHEVFVLIEGRAEYRRGDERIEAGPGTVIVIPPETPHGFENVGEEPLVQLGIHERGQMQQTWLDS